MKNKLTVLKSGEGNINDQSAKNPTRAKLYAICLNKPLIEIWALSDRYTQDYYDNLSNYKGSLYSASNLSFRGDDRIHGILSPEDELMLYNEGLSEYY